MNILVSACLFGVNCTYRGTSKEQAEICRLLKEGKHTLIPVCPEQLGGLSTPRPASECQGEKVVSCLGVDVTEQFERGAKEALRIAKLYDCKTAILKERSPSCGNGQVYDGSFQGILTAGDGVTARLLKQQGIRVLGESKIQDEKWI